MTKELKDEAQKVSAHFEKPADVAGRPDPQPRPSITHTQSQKPKVVDTPEASEDELQTTTAEAAREKKASVRGVLLLN